MPPAPNRNQSERVAVTDFDPADPTTDAMAAQNAEMVTWHAGHVARKRCPLPGDGPWNGG
jgi:hypothetical protein